MQTLLADHLIPERTRLDGELAELSKARATADRKQKDQAEKRHAEVRRWLDEIEASIAAVTECAERGPPPADAKAPAREVDARHVMDLDDGVMINSAGLWPLLLPQWKAPRKWWKELATAKGRKDYDWSHLAARYFPTRVDEKCRKDPSLGVAHGCFWRYHPAKAHPWELRLQDEITPGFTIDEPGSDEARARFLAEHPDEADRIAEAEEKRRARKQKRREKNSAGPLFDHRETTA